MMQQLEAIFHRTHDMALDLKKLTDAVVAVEARLKTLSDEIVTLKGAPPVTDPADQAAVDAVADKLTADAAAP